MDKKIFVEEVEYLDKTLELVSSRLSNLQTNKTSNNETFSTSNSEYFDYLKDNANKLNADDVVEIMNLQSRLEDIENYSINVDKEINVYKKMLNKPYFASIDIREKGNKDHEKYYIGIHSLPKSKVDYQVIDWRSPLSSIFYDYEQGACKISTNSSILDCTLLNKRQYGITVGKLDYYLDCTVNIEDEILQQALAKNSSNQMTSIVQTIQREQNEAIRGDRTKTLIVQGVAGSGKTAIALHRIAYILYKMKGKITSENIHYLSPNNAFSSYISSVLPDLAEDDVEKIQLDNIARSYLKKHLIMEKRFEQVERLITDQDLKEYNYKTSYKFLEDLLEFANTHYINNFDIEDFEIQNTIISGKKIKEFFFGKYKDRDLFTRMKWITDNIFDIYFYKVKNIDRANRYKQVIFMNLYKAVSDKNCVKAYMNFLKTKNLKLHLVGDKVKHEDAYGVLFFKMFIYGLDKYKNIEHLVIDEMQDYSPLQLHILNYLYDCPKTILGDYNQSISSTNIYNNMQKYSDIFSGDVEFLNLNKSYRSTIEIAEFYNAIGKKENAEVFARNGEEVDLVECNKNTEIDTLLRIINEYKQKSYNSIAIITKTNKQSQKLYKQIKNKLSVNLIDDNTDEYDNKICVISAFNSKGLEFDGVIVYNVSEENYNSDIDRDVLYIASTRAMHKLTIMQSDKNCKFIKDYKEKL